MTRIYHQDPTCSSIDTQVLTCRPGEDGFDVTLEDELLFPGGGGQPEDHGTIAGQKVLAVRVEDGRIVHHLEHPVAGQVRVELDRARRLDISQQHTGQHVISAMALKEFELRTTAFHIGDEVSDIEFDTEPLSPDQLEALEARVNAIVRQALPITIEVGSRDEVESGAIRSRRIAQGVSGPLRIVAIAGFDRNTCGGTHVANTAQLQILKFVGTEKLTRAYRVFYAAGERVRLLTTELLRQRDALNRLLSSGPDQHLQLVEKLQTDLRGAQKLAARQTELLAESVAEGLAESPAAHRRFDQADPAFLRIVATAYRSLRPDGRVLLAAGETQGPLLIAGPPDWVDANARQVAAAVEGRGGGRDGLFQGKAGDLSGMAQAAELLATL